MLIFEKNPNKLKGLTNLELVKPQYKKQMGAGLKKAAI